MSDTFDHEGDAWESLEHDNSDEDYQSPYFNARKSTKRQYFEPDPLYYHVTLECQRVSIAKSGAYYVTFMKYGKRYTLFLPAKIVVTTSDCLVLRVHGNTLLNIIRDH